LKFSVLTIAAVMLFLVSGAAASTLTGTVTNSTTGKPAAGDEVILIKLGQGMEEAGRTKADVRGNFRFSIADTDTSVPHLVRAIHQGVTYHKMAPPGTTSADVQVYDVSRKVQGVNVTADVMRFQAQGSELQGIRLFAVENQSSPPRTQMSDQNFEFFLPDGAAIDQGVAMTEGGQPINSAPVPQTVKNRYAFVFPLRPGTTQLEVVFHLPYSGQASINPKLLYPAEHFAVVLPKAMQFSAGSGAPYKPVQDPHQSNAILQVATKTKVGDSLAFRISGSGMLKEESNTAQNAGEQPGGEMPASGENRPGGGLGPPIDAPDPLQKYWPYILSGFAVLLVGGAIYTVKRPHAQMSPEFAAEAPVAVPAKRPFGESRSAMLLEALKEELFQLEVEHKQGHITQEEYEKAKAALDQTLERAVKRETAKTT
jgi:hypothetical protein